MKRFISLLIIGFLAGTVSVFAYTPKAQDTALLQKVNQRVEKMAQKSPDALIVIATKIEAMLPRLPEDSRAYYVIGEVYNSIMKELGEANTEDLLDGLFDNAHDNDENEEDEEDDEEDEEDDEE